MGGLVAEKLPTVRYHIGNGLPGSRGALTVRAMGSRTALGQGCAHDPDQSRWWCPPAAVRAQRRAAECTTQNRLLYARQPQRLHRQYSPSRATIRDCLLMKRGIVPMVAPLCAREIVIGCADDYVHTRPPRASLSPGDVHTNSCRGAVAADCDSHAGAGSILDYLEPCRTLARTTTCLDIPTHWRRLASDTIHIDVRPCAAITDNAGTDHPLIRLGKLRTVTDNPIPSSHRTGRRNDQAEHGPTAPQLHSLSPMGQLVSEPRGSPLLTR